MHKLPVWLLLLAAMTAHAAGAREDHVLLQGNNAGKQIVTAVGTDRTRVEYHYNDRGRGDEIKAQWRLDGNGLLVEYQARGKNYTKAKVDETFALRDGRARWNNASEQGDQALPSPAFFMPISAPPEMQGVLARALLKAPGQRLALLPSGEARVESAGTLRVQGQHGPVELSHYRMSGLGFTPASVWLHADGSTAAVTYASGWVAVLPEELKPSLPQIVAAQERADAEWSARLARDLTHQPKGPLLIRNARVFDPRDLAATPGTSVLVEGERIIRVAADALIEAPANAEVIDANGRFLLPGLWDVHKHYAEADGPLDIAGGVTSSRDLANNTDNFIARVKRFDAGTEIGPRVSMAGFIDGPGPYAGPTRMLVSTPEEARKAVDWYADHGYVQIKTYSSLKPELFPVIADRAHARGLRVSGHVPAFVSAQQFVEGGADEIQHINFIFLNFMYPRVQETRNMKRLTEIGEHAYEYTPEQPQVRDFIAFLKRHHTVLDPTLAVFEDLSGDPNDPVPPGLRPIAARLPPQVQRDFGFGALPVPKAHEDAYAKAFPALMRMVKALHDGGVTLMPGTDGLAGYLLHAELEIYARAGIPNAEVLRLATLTPAQVMGVDKDRGVIAPGKLADMVLVDGDPLSDMRDIRNVDVVLKGGKVFDPAAIEQALGIQPRKPVQAR
ncbi:amidohydrolase family protein [Bacillus subtilis subsp. subtilis]|nr:amidohydrolase family protein [Bacillus subtilis subsp. subtilis]